MSGKRVPVLAPDGQFGFVDESDVPNLPDGARTLTKAQAEKVVTDQKQATADAAEQERYDAMPLAQKALGVVNTVGGAINPLTIGTDANAPPAVAAYGAGVREGLTGGLSSGLTRQGIDATVGHAAGDKYAAQVQQTEAASPLAHGAGNIMGLGAGIVGGAGNLAEGLAAKGLGAIGVAEGASALGRAGVTAAKLGVRGATEGALIQGGEYAGHELLADHDMASDKLFASLGTGALYGGATGAVLGAGGSLAKSGLGRVFARGADAAADVAADTSAEQGGPARSLLSDLSTEAGTKARAYDRAWKAIGGGFGLQSTSFAGRAEKYLPNGTRDVGEVMMRKGIIDPEAHLLDTMKDATPTTMLPKIESALESVGQRIGAITDASGGHVAAADVIRAVEDTAREYGQAAATRPIARAVQQFGSELVDSLGINNGRASVSVQDLLRERKALDMMVFEHAALDPNVTTQVKRELRSRLEGLVVDSLDRASGRVSGDLATEYKALKKDYLALNIARDVAADSSTRSQKAAFFGLSSHIAGGGSILKSLAHKVVKERGDAVAAAVLYQQAERGGLARMVQKIDAQIDRASKGLLSSPIKGAFKPADVMPPPSHVVEKALARVAAFQSDPESYIDHASSQVESIASHSPEIANGIVQRQVQAMTFLASKVPTVPDPDPLDPHPAPHMTAGEQSEFARYAWYTERPERFFREISTGKITFEGAEVAQALMPRAFQDLQEKTTEQLATMMARGTKIPFVQREMLGVLLNIAATPSQRPDHSAFLQQNVNSVLTSDPELPSPAAPAKPRRIPNTTQRSTSSYDRLEADGPGGR